MAALSPVQYCTSHRERSDAMMRIVIAALILFCLISDESSVAQPPATQQQIADRFFEVLLRRPAPGTAFDRVYDYHAQNQSLDDFSASLDVPVDASQAGAKQMLLGLIHTRRGNPAGAVVAFQKADAWLTADANASHALSKALLANGDTDGAIDALQRAIERNPNRRQAPEIFLGLAQLYLRSGKSELASAIPQQLLKRFPDDISIAEKVANWLVDQQQLEEALEQFVRLAATAKSSESRIGYQIKAVDLKSRLGQTQQARKELMSLIGRLRPGSWLHSDVRRRLERSFLSTGDIDALVEFYNRQSERDPTNLSALIRLGEILAGVDRIDEAEKSFRKVIERAPSNIDARFAFVELLVNAGRASEAAIQMEKLLEIDRDNPDYLLRLGEIYVNDLQSPINRRRSAAAVAWNRLAETKADDPVMLVAIARRMNLIDQSDRTLELYEQAIETAPHLPQYREYLGDHLHRLGQVEDAIKVWNSMATGTRKSRDSLVRLAEVLGTFKQPELSLQTWREAAKYDLTIDQRVRFSRVLAAATKFDEALAEIESAATTAQGPDDHERLMRERIKTLGQAGRLTERIAELSLQEPSAENQRFLALLYQASGQHSGAFQAINSAMKLDPESLLILTDAVDIAEGFGEISEAASLLEKLAPRDTRFQFNHLSRLVAIREQLGEIGKAWNAANRLIEINPSSPESYRVFARIAFAMGLDDEGERALRRSLVVAPRSVEPRITLATRLAERFETGEAIELLWQAVEYERSLGKRTEMIRSLVPLYARRGEVEQLVTRIKRLELNTLKPNAKTILIASVWSSVKDYKQTQLTLRTSLNRQPRDSRLLDAMVNSLVESEDIESAARYQRRLVDAEGTPAGHTRLATLELQAGLITPLESMTREINASDNPKRKARIAIRNATKNPEQAAELCRLVLLQHPELWDLKLIRAQLLLLSDESNRSDRLAEADQLAIEVESVGAEFDALPPSITPPRPLKIRSVGSQYTLRTNAAQKSGGFSGTNAVDVSTVTIKSNGQITRLPWPIQVATGRGSFPQTAAASLRQIMTLNERRIVSRANSGAKSFSFAFGSNYISPADFYEAKWVARVVQILATYEQAKLAGTTQKPNELIADRFPQPSDDSVDVAEFRDALAMLQVMTLLDSKAKNQTQVNNLLWRIAKLDPAAEHPLLIELLAQRSGGQRSSEKAATAESIAPLSSKRLAILTELCKAHQNLAVSESRTMERILADMELRKCLISECRLAGKPHPFANPESPDANQSQFFDLASKIQDALWEQDLEMAERLVAGLPVAARSGKLGEFQSERQINWLASPSNQTEIEFVLHHRNRLIDAWIAHCSRRMIVSQDNVSPSELLGGGPLQVVVPVLQSNATKPRYEIFRLETPFSQRLISEPLLRGLAPLIAIKAAGGSNQLAVSIPKDVLSRLTSPLDGATPHEKKLRRVIAAFASWWDKRPHDCYLQLESLADEHPDDVDLQIEAARLAVINLRSSKAFDRLSRITTFDDETRVQVELARIVLAAQTGNDRLVRDASRQLLAQPIDQASRDFLSKQLQSFASRNQTVATVQQRIQKQPRSQTLARVSTEDDKTRLTLAASMIKSGDLLTASEIAYSIINRRQNSRRIDHSSARHQAIEILVHTGRLQPLITMTERKFRASPESEAYRKELADLYVAAGEPAKASRLWVEVIEALKLSPRQIVTRASTMRGKREYHHAALLYLYAIERDPSLWTSHWNVFVDAASMSTSQEIIFDHLCKIDIRSFKPSTLCSVIRLRGLRPFSESQRQFASHVVQNHPDVAEHLGAFLNAIPESERQSLPELQTMMVDAITSADAFQSDSRLWALSGWSDQGIVAGVLDDLMQLLWNDPVAAKKFIFAIDSDNGGSQPIKELLKAAFQLNEAETRESAVNTIRDRFPAEFGDARSVAQGNALPTALLWQVGQLIDQFDDIKQKTLLRVGVFQAAIRNAGDRPPALTSIGAPRDQLYREYAVIQRKSHARRGWLQRLEQSVLPKTTGVRENWQLLMAEHIADELMKIGYPVDAAAICRRFLDAPVMFRLARQYSQGRDYQGNLKIQFETAIKSIDAATAQAYLQEIQAEGSTDVIIDLCSTTFAAATDSTTDSVFELAIHSALQSESGRDSVVDLYLRIEQHLDPQDTTSKMPALLVLAAVAVPDELPALLDRLLTNLSKGDSDQNDGKEESIDSDSLDASSLRRIAFALASVRRSGLTSNTSTIERVITRLQEIASASGDNAACTAFARLSRRRESLFWVLNSIVKVPNRKMSAQQCNRCLTLAKIAADQGQWDIVAQALITALGFGPNTEAVTQMATVADEFRGRAAAQKPQSMADPYADIRERVLAILKPCRDRNGVSITSPLFDSNQCDIDLDQMRALGKTVHQIVFLSDLFVNVYPYSRRVLSQAHVRESADPYLTHAVSYAVGNTAKICGTTEALLARVRKRVNAAETPLTASLFVDLAITAGDSVDLADAVEVFFRSHDDRLPWLENVDRPDTAKKPIVPRDAAPVITIADRIIRTLRPVIVKHGQSPAIKEKTARLLKRTVKLMQENEEVQKSHVQEIKDISAMIK